MATLSLIFPVATVPTSVTLTALTGTPSPATPLPVAFDAPTVLPDGRSRWTATFSGTGTYVYTVVAVIAGVSRTLAGTVSGGTGSTVATAPGPVFEYVPTFSAGAVSPVQIVNVAGLSTAHSSTSSDRGRLYGSLTAVDGGFALTMYADRGMSDGSAVLAGEASSIATYFDLGSVNASGMSGRAYLSTFAGSDDTIVAVPTFAVDPDVVLLQAAAAQTPGWNASYGFGYVHAQAVRQMLTADLPSVLPDLYAGKAGLAPFVPGVPGSDLPDLRQLANVDQLRGAQSMLVKRLAALQSEYLLEWANVADRAGQRYMAMMTAIAKASVLQREATEAEQSGESVTFGGFSRM